MKDVFLCIDKVLDESDQMHYMLHVIDMPGKISYNRAYISSERSIELNEKEKVLFWVND